MGMFTKDHVYYTTLMSQTLEAKKPHNTRTLTSLPNIHIFDTLTTKRCILLIFRPALWHFFAGFLTPTNVWKIKVTEFHINSKGAINFKNSPLHTSSKYSFRITRQNSLVLAMNLTHIYPPPCYGKASDLEFTAFYLFKIN